MSPTSRLAKSATAMVLSGALLVTPAVASAADTTTESADRAGKKLVPTAFAFKSSGYGTMARGGDLPVGAGRTAVGRIGCTNEAGINKRSFIEESEIDGLGTVRAATTRTWTKKRRGVTSANSKHKVASVDLVQTPLGSLSITGIESTTKASYSKKNGWNAKADTKIGAIRLTPPAGDPVDIDIPSPGETITVPGLLEISLGETKERTNAEAGRARAYAYGLKVKVIPTSTIVKIARSTAQLDNDVISGVFTGSSIPAKAKVLGELVQVGRVVRQVMPCIGTDGELLETSAANLDLGGQVVVKAASAAQRGNQNRRRAWGTEVARIAEVNLGGGALVLDAIESQVKVTRTRKGKLKRTATAKVGSITAGDGDPQSLEDLDGLEIPGVLSIETGVRKKVAGGLQIVALRIRLLDGTGAKIDLGTAKLSIAKR